MKLQKVLVIGMAKSGVAAARLLSDHGCQVIINDTKNAEQLGETLEPLKACSVIEKLQCPPEDLVEGCDAVVVSPGVPLDLPYADRARTLGIPVLAEIELGARYVHCPICAITGTNGKTTTTTLLAEIFKRAGYRTWAAGNIGLPLCEIAEETRPEDRIVLETSSFMLEAIDQFHPRVSAVLNLKEDHLNRHKTMKNYIDAKARIFENQTSSDVLVLNYDDSETRALASRARCRILFFSATQPVPAGAYLLEDRICYLPEDGDKPVLMGRTGEIRIPGRHNLENALAATAMAMSMGVDPAVIRYTLAAFEGVEHRIEYVRTIQGIRYINDSKGTNVDSTLAAVHAMDRPTVLIAGGSEKNADFAPLIAGFTENITAMVVLGQTGPRIAAAAAEAGWGPVYSASSLEEAVAKASRLAVAGGNVLLSPACASFDMFQDYEQRGEVFKTIVEEMAGGAG